MAILGTQQILVALNQVVGNIQGEVQKELEQAGTNTFESSQDDCPVRSGVLKDSGHVDATPLHVEVVYDANYALFVHEGHLSRAGNPVPAQPFLEPHFEVEADALVDCLKNL